MKKIVFLFVFLLVGCESEVDKCVNSGMNAFGSKRSLEDRKKLEFQLRIDCLSASQGKD